MKKLFIIFACLSLVLMASNNLLAQSSTDTVKGTTDTVKGVDPIPPKEAPKQEKPEPSVVDKFKDTIKNKIEKLDPPNPGPGTGAVRGAADDFNCVCAECNRKCGTGHEKWCSYKPKSKDEIYNCLASYSCIVSERKISI